MDEARDSKPKSPHLVALMASGSILLAGFTVSTYCMQLRGPGLAAGINAHRPEWIVLGAALLGLAIAVHLAVARALYAARGAASVRGVLRRALEVLGTAPEVTENSEALPREVRDLVTLFAGQRGREQELERELQGARREMKDLLQRLEQSSARREPMPAEGASELVARVARAWNQAMAQAGPAQAGPAQTGPAPAAPATTMNSRLAALGASIPALDSPSAALEEPLAALDSALAALRAPLGAAETAPEALAAEATVEDEAAMDDFAPEPRSEPFSLGVASEAAMTPEIARRLEELESRFSQLQNEMLSMQPFAPDSPVVEAVPMLEPEILLDESASAAPTVPPPVPLFLEPDLEPEPEPEVEPEVEAELESPDPAWPTWPDAAGAGGAAPESTPGLSPEEDIRYARSEVVRPDQPTKAGDSGYFEWTGQSRQQGSWRLRDEAARELSRATEASPAAKPEASAAGTSVVKGTPSFEERFPHFVGKPIGNLDGRVAVSFEGGSKQGESYGADEDPEASGDAGSRWGRRPGGMERRE